MSETNSTPSEWSIETTDTTQLQRMGTLILPTPDPLDPLDPSNQSLPTDKPLRELLNVTAPSNAIKVNFIPHEHFKPPTWAKLNDIQTIIGSLYKNKAVATTKWKRERIWLKWSKDDDFVDVDYASFLTDSQWKGCDWNDFSPDSPIVLLIHGLGGSWQSSYMNLAARELGKQGIRSIALNMRGSSGVPNVGMRMYHAAAWEDVEEVLNYLLEKFPKVYFGLMGFSLGGCITLNFMGRRAKVMNDRIIAAATISPPMDLLTGSKLIEQGQGKKWTAFLLSGLRNLLKPRLQDFKTGCNGKFPIPQGFNVEKGYEAKTIKEFDEHFIAPLHGYTSVMDYYTRACPIPYLSDINRPTLIIRSRDDPFLAPNDVHIPQLRENPFIEAILTERGGHVGFMVKDKDSFLPWKLQAFAEPLAAQFFRDKFDRNISNSGNDVTSVSGLETHGLKHGTSQESPKIVVVGSINVDLYYEISRLPFPGETITSNNFMTRLGGKGANQAVAASRLYNNVSLIACIGNDVFGTKSLKELKEWGLNVDDVKVVDGETGSAIILSQSNGENSIVIVSGANGKLKKDMICLDCLDETVLLQLEVSYDVVEDILAKQGCYTIFNPSPLPNDLDKLEKVKKMCKSSKVLIVNEGELEIIASNGISLREKVEGLFGNSLDIVIVTLGGKGGICMTRQGDFFEFSSKPVNVVDTTGAGDCFAGSFSVFWTECGRDFSRLKDCLNMANGMAGLSVGLKGTMSSYACRREFSRGLQQDRCDEVEAVLRSEAE